MFLTRKNIENLIEIVIFAGNEIILNKKLKKNIHYKKDGSPVSQGDLISHFIITEGLKKLFKNSLPIISEEDLNVSIPKLMQNFWLIDPLDGTKDFIIGGDEYTVNLALICNGSPLFGIIYQPEKDLLYWGGPPFGAHKRFNGAESNIIEQRLDAKAPEKILVSKSHTNKQTLSFISKFKNFELIGRASSIKFCDLSENHACLYPRIGTIFEWDIAAGHAIIEGSGGIVLDLNCNHLKYGKKDFLSNGFVAISASFLNQIDFIKGLLQ